MILVKVTKMMMTHQLDMKREDGSSRNLLVAMMTANQPIELMRGNVGALGRTASCSFFAFFRVSRDSDSFVGGYDGYDGEGS